MLAKSMIICMQNSFICDLNFENLTYQCKMLCRVICCFRFMSHHCPLLVAVLVYPNTEQLTKADTMLVYSLPSEKHAAEIIVLLYHV